MSLRERMAADGAEIARAVETPNWGTVYVRRMSARERDRWVEKSKEALGEGVEGEFSSALSLALVLCDEKGNREFDPTNLADLEFLSKRLSSDIDVVLRAAAPEGNSAGAKS